MNPSEPQLSRAVKVDLPRSAFRRYMHFNRFDIGVERGFRLVRCGLVNKGGLLLDLYAFVLTDFAVEMSSKSSLEYFQRTFSSVSTAPQMLIAAPLGDKPCESVDIICMSNNGREAEVTLFAVSQQHMHGTDSNQIVAQPLTQLRCSLEIQGAFIKELYIEPSSQP